MLDRQPLAVRLALASIFLIFLITASITLLSLRREGRSARTELKHQAELLMRTLAAASADALYHLNADFLGDLTEALGADLRVVSARVYDHTGRIVADAHDPAVALQLRPDPLGYRVVTSDDVILVWQPDTLLVGQRVVAGRRYLGAVSVALSTVPLQARLQEIQLWGLVVGLTTAALAILLSGLMSRSITRPLRNMRTAVAHLAGGDLTTTVPRQRGLELGALADAFNGMTTQLRESIAKIEQRARELEILFETTRDLASQLDRRTVLQIVADRACELLQVPASILSVYDAEAGELEVVAVTGSPLRVGSRVPMDGAAAEQATQGRLQDVVDDRAGKLWKLSPGATAIGNMVQVPMLYQGELVGVLAVHETAGSIRTFASDEVRILTLFAGHAAAAVHNAKLFEQARERLDHLQALREIDQAINGSLDVRVTLNVLLDNVIRGLQVDAAAVLLMGRHSHTLEYGAGRGFRTTALQHTRLPLGRGYAGQAALERGTIEIPDLRQTAGDLVQSPLLAAEGFVTYYAVPLIAKGRVAGVLEVFNRTILHPDQEWLEFMEALAGQAAMALDNATLLNDLQRANANLVLAYDTTLEGWSRALDLRDQETEGHTQRVTELTVRLAQLLGLPDEQLVHIRRGALLHDIGKMGIPDGILLKPGPLTREEWEVMRRHPVYAYELLSPIGYLQPALDIPYSHHEKWDGSGYPRGLRVEQIPPAARMFAVVDVWDALTSDRPYRPAWPPEKALAHIRAEAGRHFDPAVVAAFCRLMEQRVGPPAQEAAGADLPDGQVRTHPPAAALSSNGERPSTVAEVLRSEALAG